MQKITLPFPVVQLHIANNPDQIVVPILDNNVLQINTTPNFLSGSFVTKISYWIKEIMLLYWNIRWSLILRKKT